MLNAVFGMKFFLFLLGALASPPALLAQAAAPPPMTYTRTTTILEAMIAAPRFPNLSRILPRMCAWSE